MCSRSYFIFTLIITIYSIYQMLVYNTKTNKIVKNTTLYGTNPCKISLWVFVTNVVVCLWLGEYIYAALLIILIVTSYFYRRYSKEDSLFLCWKYADLIAIQLAFWYGIYTYIWRTNRNPAPLIFAFYTMFFYYGGKRIGQFCGDPDKTTGLYYHAVLHLCASAGHHSILLDLI